MEGSELALGRGGRWVVGQAHDGPCGVTAASTAPWEPSWVAAGGCGEDGQLVLLLRGVRLPWQPAASQEEEEEEEGEEDLENEEELLVRGDQRGSRGWKRGSLLQARADSWDP